MPMPINCPACGADATSLANAVIQPQLNASSAPAAGLRVSKSTHAAPAATQTMHAAPAPDPSVLHCHRHPSEPAVETCRVCGKPICAKCMEQFGYVCSVYCRQQAEQKRMAVPACARQKNVVAARSFAIARVVTVAIVMLGVLAVGFWGWYTWVGRNPKVVFSLPIPKTDLNSDQPSPPAEYYQLIAPGELLAIKARHVSLFDIREQHQIWSAALLTDAESEAIKAARARNDEIKKNTPRVRNEDTGADMTTYNALDPLGFEDDSYFAVPHVVITASDIWVSYPDRLMRFDRQSGSPKELPISGNILNVAVSDDAILVVSGAPGAQATLTRFSLPDGAARSEELNLQTQTELATSTNAVAIPGAAKIRPVKPNETTDKYPVSQLKDLAVATGQPQHTEDDTALPLGEEHHPFIAAGPNVVQLQTRLLERKTIAHAAMKAKGESVMDSGNLTAGQSMQAAEEMMNDQRRDQTGGVEPEDVSRYEVAIHRRFAGDVPDWTGEVTGPPQFFPLKTVDVLCAGQTIYVFDKTNKKLWEAKLTFPVATHLAGDYFPCLETGDALYFADLGILTRYDLGTGSVRWRVNSVGISRIQADERGALYVDSTTAGPDSIQYSQQINIHDKIHPLILKIEPGTGKIVWRLENVGDHVLLSGKFLYAIRMMSIYVALRLEEGPDRHYYLRLLDPADGKEIWSSSIHKVNRRVIKTEVQKNWILVQLDDEVVVYKFFSL
jgi:hypothetical protein